VTDEPGHDEDEAARLREEVGQLRRELGEALVLRTVYEETSKPPRRLAAVLGTADWVFGSPPGP
jgi:hypothetical protein